MNNHDGVVTHLEPDILDHGVKWALGSIITNKGSDGIWAELFTILKDNAVKVLHSLCQQIWKTQQGPQDWKKSGFIPIPKKGNVKQCWNYCTIALISHALKVRFKILQAKFQQYGNRELPDMSVQFSSFQSLSHVQLFATPWTAAHQTSLSITNYWSLFKLMSIELVMPSNHLILCHPLLLPPSIFPSIRIFSNESVLCIRWP